MEAALLAAIRAAPDDDASRLVYADWLLDRGDARGELIQIQCRIARSDGASSALCRRERELLELHQEAWIGTPYDEGLTWTFDRGFPTGRFGHAGLFVTPGERAFSCLLFAPGGVVVSAGIGGERCQASFASIARWLPEHQDRGAYAATFEANAPPHLRFRTSSRAGSVDHHGTLHGRTLRLASHSLINGWEGSVIYELTPVPGCDSRAPLGRQQRLLLSLAGSSASARAPSCGASAMRRESWRPRRCPAARAHWHTR